MDWKKVKKHVASTTVEERNAKRQAVSERDVEIFRENYGKVASGISNDAESRDYVSSAKTAANAGAISALERRRQRAEEYLEKNTDKYKNGKELLSETKNLFTSIEDLANANLAVENYWGQFGSEEGYNDYFNQIKEQERLEYLDIKEARDKKYALEQELNELRRRTGGTTSIVSSALSSGGGIYNPSSRIETDRVRALQDEINALERDINLASRKQTNKYLTDRAINAEDFGSFSFEPEREKKVINPHQQNIERDNSAERFMTEDEKAIYNYYFNKVGEAKAEEYLDSIQEDLNFRQAKAIFEGNEDNVLAQLALMAPTQGLEQSKSGFQGALRMVMGNDSYQPVSTYDYLGQMAKEDLADKGFKLPEWMGGQSIGQLAYDLVNTGANMAPSIAVGALTGTGPLAFGASAAGNAYTQKINEGYSKEQATAYGVIIGVSEATLEKVVGAIGFGGKTLASKAVAKLLPKIDNAAARIAVKYGSSMLSEGIEEGLQEVLEPLYRNAAFGENNELEITEDAIYSALLGALSGGLMEGTPYAISEGINASYQNKINEKYGKSVGEIVTEGLSAPQDSEAYKLAKEAKAKLNAGEELSDGELDVLAKVSAEVPQERKQAVTEASEAKPIVLQSKEIPNPGRRTVGISEKQIETFASKLPNATEDTGKQVAAMYDIKDGVSKETFIRGVDEAYRYGSMNFSVAEMDKGSSFAKDIPSEKKLQAYYMGQRNAETATITKANEQQKKALSGVKGKVVFEGNAATQIKNNQQRSTIRFINSVLKNASSMEYHIFASYEEDGKRVYKNSEGKVVPAPNGFYDPKNHQIWIDVNAGAKGQGIMLYTLTHEHVHDIKVWSAEHYNELVKITSQAFEHAGKSFKEAVDVKYAQYKKSHSDTTYEDAQEEVVAEAMSGLLSDEKGLREFSEQIQKQDKGLWNRIKAWFNDVIARITAAYKDVEPESEEAKLLMEQRELFEHAQKVFAEAVVTAGGNYKNSGAQSSTSQVKNADTNAKFQARNSDGSQQNQEKDSEGNILSAEQVEFFEDSKVRDENGNLLVVYHGTRKADFTVFNRSFNFFTDSEKMADSYAPNGEKFQGYLNIEKPFIIDAKGEKWSKIPIDSKTKDLLDRYGSSSFKEGGKWRSTPADIVYAIMDSIDEGEFDYDGVIVKNVDDTGSYLKEKNNVVANDYITFNSNQFKNLDNKAPTKNPDIRYQDRDSEYMEAIKKADIGTMQKLVEEAAKEAGYTEKLYHGTNQYGFTKADVSKSDDKISFFATDSEEVAQTYSGVGGTRWIADDSLSEESIDKAYDNAEKEMTDAENELYFAYNRVFSYGLDFKDLSHFADDLSDDLYMGKTSEEDIYMSIDEYLNLWSSWTQLKEDYGEFEDYEDFDDWEDSEEAEPIWTAMANLEHAIILYAKVRNMTGLEDLGNYELYANVENLFEIDAKGKAWNQIPFDEYDTNGFHPRVTTRELAAYSKNEGYKGVKITNVYDDGGRGKYQTKPATVYIFFNPQEQVKSADPVTKDDNGNVIPLSERFKKENDDIRYSEREFSEEFISNTVNSFGINKLGDYIHVQRQVFDTLVDEGFFTDTETRSRTDVNEESGMVIETNKSGIDETFSLQSYGRVGKNKKITKLATIRMLPEIIRNGSLVGDDVENLHNPSDTNKKFAYINYTADVDGKEVPIKLTIKKSLKKNKFWVHSVETKIVSNYPAGNTDITGAGYRIADNEESIAPKKEDVKHSLRGTYNKEGMSEKDVETANKVISNLRWETMAARYGVVHTAAYTAERIERELNYSSANRPDYAKSYVAWVNPSDFVFATTVSYRNRETLKTEAGTLDVEKLSKESQPIYLIVDFENGRILGHEGRHRMLALEEAGIEKVAVIIDARNDDTYNTKPIERMRLEGQRFSDYEKGSNFSITSMLPLSARYADVAKELFTQKTDSGINYQERLSTADKNRVEILENKNARLEKELADLEKAYESVQNYARAEGILIGQVEQGKTMAKEMRQKQASFDRKAKGYENAIAKKKEQISAVRQQKNDLLAKAKAERAEAVERVRKADRERMEKAIADIKATERAKFNAAKERSDEQKRAIIEKYQTSIKKATEGRHRTDIRGKIKRVVNELNTLLTKQTKERHVPLELQKPVADALDILNLDDQRYYESRIRGLEARIAEAKSSEERHLLQEELNKITDHRAAFKDKIAGLKKAYEAIKNSTDPFIAVGYNENIAKMIDRVAEDIGDTLLRDMNMTQLQEVYDLYKGILKTVRDANKFFNEEKGASVVEAGRNVVSEIEASGKTIDQISKKKLERKKFFSNNLKPVYAFKKLGSKTLENLFGGILKGQGTWAKDVSEAKDFFERTGNKYGYKKWDKKKIFEFTSNTGKKFSLNLQQMMSLYAYSKRDQAFKHLTDGGFVFDNKETIKKNGKEYVVNTAQAYNISAATLQQIIGKLSTDQRMFVDEMQKYLSETMGAKGNEVSRAMYDIELFREAEGYFPLKSAKQFLYDRNEVTNETRQLVNSGFTKPIQPGANNPIILTGFMDVWANHVNDMSMYHAFVMPIENFNKVYNFQFGRSEESDSKSVKSAIQDSFTEAANQYIEQLLKDINGGARVDSRESTYKRLVGNWKKAAVFASASVVVQQPSAIGRAFAEINPVYFMAPTEIGVLKHKKQWEQLKKYAPVAVIKEMGYFDTDMGQSTAEFIKGEKTLKDRADDVFGFAPAKADEYTWCAIWDAVKRETKAKHKDLNVNSEEFLKIAGERFTEVIDKTQVYDSVLSRSGNMRSKSIFMQMLTAFMAEPTTSANMVEQAFREAKAGHKKKAMAYINSVGASVVLNSLLVSFVYALRDDDEDERFHDKYLEALLKELVDGFNPLTYIPLAKDVWSIFQGWDVERVDMSLFKDLYDNLEKEVKTVKELVEGIIDGSLSEEEIKAGFKEAGEYMFPVLDTIASMNGIPLKNLRRDFYTMPKNTIKIFKNQKDLSYSEKYLWDILHEAFLDQTPFGHIFFESKDEKLFNAFDSEDKVYIGRLEKTYSSEDAYSNAAKAVIKKGVIGGEFSESQAKTYLVDYIGLKPDDAEGYIHSWKFEEKWGFAWSDRAEAYANGQIKEDKLKQAVMEYKEFSAEETDKAEKEVEKIKFKAENGFDYSARRNEYIEGNITKEQLKKALMDVDGKTSEEADMQIKLYDLQKAGFEEVTEYAVKDYYEFCEPAGISEEVYFKFFEETKDIKGDYDSKGESIPYSKTKKIMPYIAKLPLSAKQKTAVAKSFGWADKTIAKYRLW